MKRLVIFLSFILQSALTAWGGELVVMPRQVHNGDVALLRWHGAPLSFGVVRFDDEIIYLYPDRAGAVALLPVGLEASAGDYPLLAALVDEQGRTSYHELRLKVETKSRPLEKLTLPQRMVTPDEEALSRINHEARLLHEIFAGRSARLWSNFTRPVADPISSVFGKRRLMNGQPRSPHSGTDFRSPHGTPVQSMSDGRVVLVKDLFYTGITVVVDHGEGLFSLYAHLSEVAVDQGQELIAGEVLGEVGSTGRSTGAHLHLTVRLLGERVDPVALLDLMQQESRLTQH